MYFLRMVALALVCVMALQTSFVISATAQQAGTLAPGEKPIMENVFFNVVWGSIAGMMLGAALATGEAEVKTQPENVSDRIALGATWGGLIGLGTGIWLATNGITFDPSAVLFQFDRPKGMPPLGYNDPPFELQSEPGKPFRITGAKARVINLRF